jgi:glycosyltransferase involved in cell wall biosynthesis
MKVLILAEGYPSTENLYNMAYIHSRVLQYVKSGIIPTILSFQAKSDYAFEGIKVVSSESFKQYEDVSIFDVVISHAPNLRHHFLFLLKHRKKIKSLVFFIHGHEVLIKRNYYPRPFDFDAKAPKEILHAVYDRLKVFILSFLFTFLLIKVRTKIVFVSKWMETETLKNVKLNPDLMKKHSLIIPNNIHHIFYENDYVLSKDIWADFITIRPLDNPKYGIDIVAAVARANPQYTFHVYGKGKYFKFHPAPANLVLKEKFVPQSEMVKILNHYRAAIMPTRLDSQGVSVCEFASFGIPVFTSDLSICKEMVGDFGNVKFFNNENTFDYKNVKPFEEQISSEIKRKFAPENTVDKEIKLLREIATNL